MANRSFYFLLFMVVIIVFLFISFISGKGTGRIAATHATSRVLMNQNLSILFVFLRFHTLEIGNLAVDKSLDAWPANRKPLHAIGVGDDEVEP